MECAPTSDEVAEHVRQRTQFYLCGEPVCVPGFCAVLGIGLHRLYKWVHGIFADGRQFGNNLRFAPQSLVVDRFFRDIYHTATEPFPKSEHISGVENHILNNPDLAQEEANVQMNGLPEQLLDGEIDHCPVELLVRGARSTVRGVQKRFLGPQSVTDLYWQFLAWYETSVVWTDRSKLDTDIVARDAPSFSTFHRAFKLKWSKVIGFRCRSEHSECQTCFEMRRAIYHTHMSPVEKLATARLWKQHLQDQYHDRLVYWSIRHAARHVDSDILSVIIDGLDKKKAAYPKWDFDRKPKNLESLKAQRPRTVGLAKFSR